MTNELSPSENLANELIKSLEHEPENWRFDDHLAMNSESGIKLWIANGMIFVNVYAPFKLKFSLYNKWRIWQEINKCKAKVLLLRLNYE